jgi:hypothetical protein
MPILMQCASESVREEVNCYKCSGANVSPRSITHQCLREAFAKSDGFTEGASAGATSAVARLSG